MSYRLVSGVLAEACLLGWLSFTPDPALSAPKKKVPAHQYALDRNKDFAEMLDYAEANPHEQVKSTLLGVASISLGSLEDAVVAEAQGGSPHALDDGLMGAADRITLAEAENKLGCRDDARKELLDLFEVYTGSGYEALRERAKVDLDDMRTAAPVPHPAYCPRGG